MDQACSVWHFWNGVSHSQCTLTGCNWFLQKIHGTYFFFLILLVKSFFCIDYASKNVCHINNNNYCFRNITWRQWFEIWGPVFDLRLKEKEFSESSRKMFTSKLVFKENSLSWEELRSKSNSLFLLCTFSCAFEWCTLWGCDSRMWVKMMKVFIVHLVYCVTLSPVIAFKKMNH